MFCFADRLRAVARFHYDLRIYCNWVLVPLNFCWTAIWSWACKSNNAAIASSSCYAGWKVHITEVFQQHCKLFRRNVPKTSMTAPLKRCCKEKTLRWFKVDIGKLGWSPKFISRALSSPSPWDKFQGTKHTGVFLSLTKTVNAGLFPVGDPPVLMALTDNDLCLCLLT